MKCLVTGGAGFIGSHITEILLGEGHEVTVIDNYSTGRPQNIEFLNGNSKLQVFEMDIAVDDMSAQFKGIDFVFHIAGLADIVPSIENPTSYFQSNVVGTQRVLEYAKENNVKKVVYAASSSCYGIATEIPTTENAEIKPEYPYALTKRMGEELVMHYSLVYDLPCLSLRLFNVYGPRSRTSGTYGAVFGIFLKQKLANKPYTVVGDGTQTRDFTFVTDVANAFIAAAKSDVNGEIMNVGSNGTYSVNQLVGLLGGDVEYIPKRPGEPDCTYADITKIKSLLNWSPKVSLEAGVGILLENINYWKEAPLWNKDSIADATKSWFKYLGKEQVET